MHLWMSGRFVLQEVLNSDMQVLPEMKKKHGMGEEKEEEEEEEEVTVSDRLLEASDVFARCIRKSFSRCVATAKLRLHFLEPWLCRLSNTCAAASAAAGDGDANGDGDGSCSPSSLNGIRTTQKFPACFIIVIIMVFAAVAADGVAVVLVALVVVSFPLFLFVILLRGFGKL